MLDDIFLSKTKFIYVLSVEVWLNFKISHRRPSSGHQWAYGLLTATATACTKGMCRQTRHQWPVGPIDGEHNETCVMGVLETRGLSNLLLFDLEFVSNISKVYKVRQDFWKYLLRSCDFWKLFCYLWEFLVIVSTWKCFLHNLERFERPNSQDL